MKYSVWLAWQRAYTDCKYFCVCDLRSFGYFCENIHMVISMIHDVSGIRYPGYRMIRGECIGGNELFLMIILSILITPQSAQVKLV